MTMHRRLVHATADPNLDAFYLGETASTEKKSLETWIDK